MTTHKDRLMPSARVGEVMEHELGVAQAYIAGLEVAASMPMGSEARKGADEVLGAIMRVWDEATDATSRVRREYEQAETDEE